jgi:hypothetical protein
MPTVCVDFFFYVAELLDGSPKMTSFFLTLSDTLKVITKDEPDLLMSEEHILDCRLNVMKCQTRPAHSNIVLNLMLIHVRRSKYVT